jgi:hypothetical protein
MVEIHRTKTGRKYLLDNSKRVYLDRNVSKKEATSIYKHLRKAHLFKRKVKEPAVDQALLSRLGITPALVAQNVQKPTITS